MSAGQEIGSPIRENRTLLPAPLPPDEARATLAAAAGVSTVGLRPPFDTPAAAFSSRLSRRSHLDCRAASVADSRGADAERLTGSGGRLHFGMGAGFKSERWPASNRNRWPDCVGIRTVT